MLSALLCTSSTLPCWQPVMQHGGNQGNHTKSNIIAMLHFLIYLKYFGYRLLTVKGQKGYSCRRKKMELWKT